MNEEYIQYGDYKLDKKKVTEFLSKNFQNFVDIKDYTPEQKQNFTKSFNKVYSDLQNGNIKVTNFASGTFAGSNLIEQDSDALGFIHRGISQALDKLIYKEKEKPKIESKPEPESEPENKFDYSKHGFDIYLKNQINPVGELTEQQMTDFVKYNNISDVVTNYLKQYNNFQGYQDVPTNYIENWTNLSTSLKDGVDDSELSKGLSLGSNFLKYFKQKPIEHSEQKVEEVKPQDNKELTEEQLEELDKVSDEILSWDNTLGLISGGLNLANIINPEPISSAIMGYGADILDAGLDLYNGAGWETLSNLGKNLLGTTAGLIPYAGDIANAAKTGNKIVQFTGKIIGLLDKSPKLLSTISSVPVLHNSINTLGGFTKKFNEDPSQLESSDYRNAANALRDLIKFGIGLRRYKKSRQTPQPENKPEQPKPKNELSFRQRLANWIDPKRKQLTESKKQGGVLKGQSGLTVPAWFDSRQAAKFLSGWDQNLRKDKWVNTKTFRGDPSNLQSVYTSNQAYINSGNIQNDLTNYRNQYKDLTDTQVVDQYNKYATDINNFWKDNKVVDYRNSNFTHTPEYVKMFFSRSINDFDDNKGYILGYQQDLQNQVGSANFHRRMDQYEKDWDQLTDEEKRSRLYTVGNTIVFKNPDGTLRIFKPEEVYSLFPDEQVNSVKPKKETEVTIKDGDEKEIPELIKYKDSNNIVDYLPSLLRYFNTSRGNDKIRNIQQSRKPLSLINLTEIKRYIHGNLRAINEGQQAAGQLNSLMQQPFTSDANSSAARAFAGFNKARDYVGQGLKSDEQIVRETIEKRWQQDKENLLRNHEITNQNRRLAWENENNKLNDYINYITAKTNNRNVLIRDIFNVFQRNKALRDAENEQNYLTYRTNYFYNYPKAAGLSNYDAALLNKEELTDQEQERLSTVIYPILRQKIKAYKGKQYPTIYNSDFTDTYKYDT